VRSGCFDPRTHRFAEEKGGRGGRRGFEEGEIGLSQGALVRSVYIGAKKFKEVHQEN
jgi:hypothetical protein